MSITVIILAAGEGTRMHSDIPKVMHKVAGKPMIQYLIECAYNLNGDDIRIVASDELMQQEHINKINELYKGLKFITQKERLGTAHAVSCAIDQGKLAEKVVILYADTPLINSATIKKMINEYNDNNAQIINLGFHTKNPKGYGRLITQYDNELFDIVEEKDTNEEQKKINLCNSGIILIKGELLRQLIQEISNQNSSSEYYLTDIIKIANTQGVECRYTIAQEFEVKGVNDRIQLAEIENIIQNILRKKAMAGGVTMIDPETVWLCSDTKFAHDIMIHQNVVIGEKVEIKKNVEIMPFSHIEGVTIAPNVSIGPFARIRSDTVIEENAKIGNFVEIKKSHIGKNTKAAHLAYIGNTILDENVNIGAGTIFCNYDGEKKNTSKVGKNSLIGSNSSIIAPVNIDSNVVVAAGSVITDDIEENSLAIARSRQITKKRK